MWQVSPFITSIFFILGVFTLYQVIYDGLKTLLHARNIKIDDDLLNSWLGVIYMLIFIFSMQATLVGTPISWQFMNFQLIALIFCAYFLNIHVRWYYLIPLMLIYMIFNGSIIYWESWCHGLTLMIFYLTLNYFRRHQKNDYPFMYYILVGTFFSSLLWMFMKIKLNLTWSTYLEEWSYFIIFDTLLYSYVGMILRDSQLKLHLLEFANHDALTKTQNYAAYSSQIKYLFNDCANNKLHLSMMMFDIDHFKSINDTYGHLAGDQILQHVVDVAQTVIDANDPKVKLYRTGGEEFNILFPGYDLAATESIVREIFLALNHLTVNINDQTIRMSISVGVSTISSQDTNPIDFYKRVDTNLYYSKKNGRMQITTA
ncbi:protein containing diguanylate cyclase phosphodiesterase domain 1 (ggdef) [Companilactobacillus crustorum]|uniref:Protein containing diguanylate cyclase phosphodiesterase domain 1 (Ggdef) n=2 Tax=Companilactobacillus crustorum TaxID=392416 RepID=A0A837RHR5_9LACO|nr:protein containing diguanylate cyclase phosphodiesterase domain 1 (ggdef) [Companilactobacillus crustorum JCM 15951]KRO20793.1 protein containing diguanylate cyclase phosphodiesterase domain 1 (ggdef) [Companilactobacillus crustorum]